MPMVSKVGERRNFFAHTLTGAYRSTEEPECQGDAATMHDTLFTVGELASHSIDFLKSRNLSQLSPAYFFFAARSAMAALSTLSAAVTIRGVKFSRIC
jgi:hypothetical protein